MQYICIIYRIVLLVNRKKVIHKVWIICGNISSFQLYPLFSYHIYLYRSVSTQLSTNNFDFPLQKSGLYYKIDKRVDLCACGAGFYDRLGERHA